MRTTSEVTDARFPYAEDTTPFLLVYNLHGLDEITSEITSLIPDKDYERGFSHARTVEKKIELVERAQRLQAAGVECSLLASWPGGRHTDTFLVDVLDEALAYLKM